jgi:hypothetical protein
MYSRVARRGAAIDSEVVERAPLPIISIYVAA